MNEINAVTAVTAGSLVASALLAHDRRGLGYSELVSTCEHLARTLHGYGARFSASLADRSRAGEVSGEALHEAIDLFVRAGNVETHRVGGDVVYVVPPASRMSLDFAKNATIHFFAARAIIATALLAAPGPPIEMGIARERVLALSRLFKYEFMFRSGVPFERIFEEEIAGMQRDGEIDATATEAGAPTLVPRGEAGQQQVVLYARLLENFVDGYRVAGRGLATLLRGPLASKDLVKRALVMGRRMFLAGEIARPEGVSRTLIENAYASFADQGYLVRDSGKLALAESYATLGAVATIESRIVAMGAFARDART
jgi:glycerol-3-phosphate O-acyltransferase